MTTEKVESPPEKTSNESSSYPLPLFSRLKQVKYDLFSLDETPLLGFAPEFPIDQFQDLFQETFQTDCSLELLELSWKEKKEILSGISSSNSWTKVSCSGIDSALFVLIGRKDLEAIASTILKTKELDDEFTDAFHHFFAIELCQIVNHVPFDQRVSYRIESYDECHDEYALCQDIRLTVNGESIFLRLVMPKEFQSAWKTYYIGQSEKELPTLDRLEDLFLTLGIEAGKTTLPLSELLAITPGDFLTIDHPSFIPESESNYLYLTLNSRPIALSEYNDGQLKIIQIPVNQEVNDTMVDNVDESFTEDEIGENPFEENPFEDEEEDEDDFTLSSGEQGKSEQREAKEAPVAVQAKPKAVQKPKMGTKNELTSDDIPLTVSVEVGKLQISCQKLLELQPANLLDLELPVDSSVDLVVNGKTIAKGELLQLGETLGVRILQIGPQTAK